MSIIVSAIKISLGQLAKLAGQSPGLAYNGVMGASAMGFAVSAPHIGQESKIYIPFYGVAGIDAGVVGYTASGVGFLAGLGTVAALSVGAPVATGVTALAVGVGLIAAVVNPDFQEAIFDRIDEIREFLQAQIDEGDLSPNIIPMELPEFNWLSPGEVSNSANISYLNARGWAPPRDPLVLDLDADGIETVGIGSNPVLFDHDGNGVKTGTGWVKPDDGFLVLDRNGNGLIDSGRKLFGVDTVKSNGQLATDGFDALLDHDGKIDAADPIFSQLRVWLDLNQDGISQANELLTLSELGITSINVTGTAVNVNLGNGNSMVSRGTFTRADGSVGASGASDLSGTAGNLLLASNNFHRKFTDDLALTGSQGAARNTRRRGAYLRRLDKMKFAVIEGQSVCAA